MEDKKKNRLFRTKNLEAMDSPESLNDYLRVTSPGVWLVLAVVTVLLAGGILWGIFGRIETKAQYAVSSTGGQCLCYVSYEDAQMVLARGTVAIEGQDYALITDAEYEISIISQDTNARIRMVGSLSPGDVTVPIPVDADLPDGVYTGTVVIESLQPISLLLQ